MPSLTCERICIINMIVRGILFARTETYPMSYPALPAGPGKNLSVDQDFGSSVPVVKESDRAAISSCFWGQGALQAVSRFIHTNQLYFPNGTPHGFSTSFRMFPPRVPAGDVPHFYHVRRLRRLPVVPWRVSPPQVCGQHG